MPALLQRPPKRRTITSTFHQLKQHVLEWLAIRQKKELDEKIDALLQPPMGLRIKQTFKARNIGISLGQRMGNLKTIGLSLVKFFGK